MFMKIIVAEVNRRDDFPTLSQLRLQPARRSRRAVGHGNWNVRFLFTADAGEKLVQNMHDANHGFSLSALSLQ